MWKRERASRVYTPWSVRRSTVRRVLAFGASVASASVLIAVTTSSAGAVPQPTVAQVQAQLVKLNAQTSKLGQQYDQVLTQLATASQRLKVLNQQTAQDRITFDRLRAQLGRIAAMSYEQGGLSSPMALLASGTPQDVLNQSSILAELSAASSTQLSQFVLASKQLVAAQRQASQAQQGILQLKKSVGQQLDTLNALKAKQETLLAQLSPAQQSGLGPGSGTGASTVTYHGGTSTQGDKAVSFAYAQIGKPYQWGATGPGSYDCSGLTSSAWAYAGVSIPRVSYAQMSQLPSVSIAYSNGTWPYLRPGDILGFGGNSHVGIYVGNGYMIDAPQTGYNVERVALAGWFARSLDGAVRP